MTINREQQPLLDLLQSLQIQLLTAHKSQVSDSWGEVDTLTEYNKLYFICEGEGWIQINGKDYYPKAGQLFLTPVHAKISFSALNKRPYLKYWCHFTVTAGPQDLFQWIGVPLCIDVEDKEHMMHLFQTMIKWHNQHSVVAKLREKQLLLEVIACFLETAPIHVLHQRTEEMERLAVIQKLVESHLHTGISIDQLAASVHLHPNYFINYFKKNFGIPPLKYVNRKRAEHAQRLLASTTLSIKEIAEQIGFQDTSHFTRFFKKEAGLSPTEYRAART